MQTTVKRGAKPRMSRARSAIATLGVAAALVGVAMPAALPATAAAAKPASGYYCAFVEGAVASAASRNDVAGAEYWIDIAFSRGCYG